MKNRLYYEDGVEQSAVPFDSIMVNGRAQFIEVTKSEIPASSLSCSGMRSKFLAKPSSQAVGMAVRSHWTLKSIKRETLFLDQLHDFSLLSLNSFLHSFLKSKVIKKIS